MVLKNNLEKSLKNLEMRGELRKEKVGEREEETKANMNNLEEKVREREEETKEIIKNLEEEAKAKRVIINNLEEKVREREELERDSLCYSYDNLCQS
ncbi:16646_t:CDS:2 [Funneliformis mosseae]|uniref:16646_t:CDS:1 n=1 Tax=Funneliformis mosseae TaxID=27381 RepID=A0A9N9FKF0_FUNMO|nr:16646_t:CDS:2 [Funneliformis mosseae]